jgi:hypothetical protein
VERTGFFRPCPKRAVRYAGHRAAPRSGDTPWTPGPLSLPSQVPERCSPSSVRSGKAFPTRQRFSSAAQKARALDGSGPFPRLPEIRASRHMQSSLAAGSCHPLVGPELFKKLGVDETS